MGSTLSPTKVYRAFRKALRQAGKCIVLRIRAMSGSRATPISRDCEGVMSQIAGRSRPRVHRTTTLDREKHHQAISCPKCQCQRGRRIPRPGEIHRLMSAQKSVVSYLGISFATREGFDKNLRKELPSPEASMSFPPFASSVESLEPIAT